MKPKKLFLGDWSQDGGVEGCVSPHSWETIKSQPLNSHWFKMKPTKRCLHSKTKRKQWDEEEKLLVQWNQIWYTTGEQSYKLGKKNNYEVGLQEKILSPESELQPWGPAMENHQRIWLWKPKESHHRNSTGLRETEIPLLECTHKVWYAPRTKGDKSSDPIRDWWGLLARPPAEARDGFSLAKKLALIKVSSPGEPPLSLALITRGMRLSSTHHQSLP